MLTTMALAAALTLAPAQAGFTLGGARVTHGELGNVRQDLKFLPGDIFFVGFDIEGIKVDAAGKVKYSMGMEVIDKDKKPIFSQKPQDREDFLPLGGTKLPARAFVSIGFDQAPGAYTCRVTVVDLATKVSKTLDQPFDVLKAAFGIVQFFTSSDPKGEIPAPPLGVAGQSIYVHFAIVGFARDPKKMQPSIQVEMSVKNKDGTPTLANPTTISITSGVDAADSGIPLRFLLPMNRAGDFTVELKATDAISKTTSQLVFPIKVLQSPN
jgi:hypothetical protein